MIRHSRVQGHAAPPTALRQKLRSSTQIFSPAITAGWGCQKSRSKSQHEKGSCHVSTHGKACKGTSRPVPLIHGSGLILGLFVSWCKASRKPRYISCVGLMAHNVDMVEPDESMEMLGIMPRHTISKEYLCILLKGLPQCAGVSLRVAHLFIRFGIRHLLERAFNSGGHAGQTCPASRTRRSFRI